MNKETKFATIYTILAVLILFFGIVENNWIYYPFAFVMGCVSFYWIWKEWEK